MSETWGMDQGDVAMSRSSSTVDSLASQEESESDQDDDLELAQLCRTCGVRQPSRLTQCAGCWFREANAQAQFCAPGPPSSIARTADGQAANENQHGSWAGNPPSLSSVRRFKKSQCTCNACSRPDCGECPCCRDMPKFGGPGLRHSRCANRKCLAPKAPPQPKESTGCEAGTFTVGGNWLQLTREDCAQVLQRPEVRSSSDIMDLLAEADWCDESSLQTFGYVDELAQV